MRIRAIIICLAVAGLMGLGLLSCSEAPFDPDAWHSSLNRGDFNGDGVPYHFNDVFVFADHIIGYNRYGYDSWTDHLESISDVNNDGFYAGVADLVFFNRIVRGEAQPTDKVNPITANLTIDSSLSVYPAIGAAYVVLRGDQTPIMHPYNNLRWVHFDGRNTHVLTFSANGYSFIGEFLWNIKSVVSVEISSVEGARVWITYK